MCVAAQTGFLLNVTYVMPRLDEDASKNSGRPDSCFVADNRFKYQPFNEGTLAHLRSVRRVWDEQKTGTSRLDSLDLLVRR